MSMLSSNFEVMLKVTSGRLSRCIVVAAVLFMMVEFPVLLFCQEQSKAPRQPEVREQSAPPQPDVYQILDQARRLADEVRGLEPREEEIRLQAGLADSVWAIDQSLGQRLLLRSFDLTVASLKEPPSSINQAPGTTDPHLLFSQISSIAARHDAKLEKQLTESWQNSVASGAGKESESKTDPAQLSYLLFRQSTRYLGNDEQKAHTLFKQSVYLRVLPAHCFFLMGQRKRGAEVTDRLFSDVLEVLAQRPLFEANEILMLSSYLFSPDDSVAYLAISGYNAANVAGNASAAPKNPALARPYLTLLVARLNPGDAPPAVVYFALKNLIPQYQAFAPELLEDVYAKIAGLGPGVSKDDSAGFESAYKDLSASQAEALAGWEKRLRDADQISREDRRDLEYYTILMGYLVPRKDFTRAAQVVNRMTNPDLKSKLSDFLNFTSLRAGLEKTETATALSEADCNRIKDPLLRVVALSSLGAFRIKQKAMGDALRFLDRAMLEAKHVDNDQDRLQAKLMLAALDMSADPALGFDSAAETFREINKFPDFNMRRSIFSLHVAVYGLSNELLIESPLTSSLTSTVARMSHVNSIETFQTCRLLTEKKTRSWATFEAVRVALLDAAKVAKPGSQKPALQ